MVDWKDTGKTEEKGAELSASDYYTQYAKDPGAFFVAHGAEGSGKTFPGFTWYDRQCMECKCKFETPKSGKIICPECSSGDIRERVILAIDTELGRLERLRRKKFSHKLIKVVEIRVLKEDYDPETTDDSTDIIATQKKFVNFLMQVYKDIKDEKFLPSIIIVDSGSDIWEICQEWGLQELIRYNPKYSEKNAKMMRTEVQFDFKVMNNRHFKYVQHCRAISNYGVDIYWTARIIAPPDYTGADAKTSWWKALPFHSDNKFRMEHKQTGSGTKAVNSYSCIIEKFDGEEAFTEPIDRINWRKIQDLVEKAKNGI